jgi:hypothetical protein
MPFGEDYQQNQICSYENTEDYAGVAGIYRDHNHRYERSASCNDGAVYHTVVGMYRPNKFGLHDMIGNVKELLQTCYEENETAPSQCQKYVVAGEAWHWQARDIGTSDWIAADFYGSIEGFRVVLDSNQATEASLSTKAFAKALIAAQKEARKLHQQLKSIPASPAGLRATQGQNNKVTLSWMPDPNDNITYSVYRSYIDPKGKLSRKPEQIAEGLKNASFVDIRSGNGATAYKVFAKSSMGESMASNEVSVGLHHTFTIDERIPAEHFKEQRNTWIRYNEQGQSIGFSSNANHYATGKTPFLPAWLKFDFTSHYIGQAVLNMRVRGPENALIEIWQGHNLITRLSTGKENAFAEIETTVSLIKGELPLEIRAANQKSFEIDWLEFKSK